MWQQEQELQCPGCGLPKDEVWVFEPDEQKAKEAAVHAGRRKCVACAAVEWDQHKLNQNRSEIPPSLRMGIHPTVERDEG